MFQSVRINERLIQTLELNDRKWFKLYGLRQLMHIKSAQTLPNDPPIERNNLHISLWVSEGRHVFVISSNLYRLLYFWTKYTKNFDWKGLDIKAWYSSFLTFAFSTLLGWQTSDPPLQN